MCALCTDARKSKQMGDIQRWARDILLQDLPILRRVTAQINIWSELSLMQTRLSDLHRIFLRLDCPLDVCDRPLSIQDGVAYLYKRYNVQLDLFSARSEEHTSELQSPDHL